MESNPEKSSLRKTLLEKRDATSYDLIKISSKQIQTNLEKIEDYRNAKSIAFYYPIGSEVLTQGLMLKVLSLGKDVLLPKVIGDELEFRKVKDFDSLEKGGFDIMEPKDICQKSDQIDVVIVPTVGISPDGSRLGYGHGYYDRFLSKTNAVSIALTYEKQIVKSVPSNQNDVKINWIVTEDRFFKAQ
ncbi:MAG: 5-formyltetrahydrofolate cyclo-ligase [Nitrosopumilaceae archaeon]